MILEGLTVTIVGMTVVFIFLTLLVYAMKLLSFIVIKYIPDQGASGSKQTRPTKQTPVQPTNQPFVQVSQDAEVAAAVAAVRVFTNN